MSPPLGGRDEHQLVPGSFHGTAVLEARRLAERYQTCQSTSLFGRDAARLLGSPRSPPTSCIKLPSLSQRLASAHLQFLAGGVLRLSHEMEDSNSKESSPG